MQLFINWTQTRMKRLAEASDKIGPNSLAIHTIGVLWRDTTENIYNGGSVEGYETALELRRSTSVNAQSLAIDALKRFENRKLISHWRHYSTPALWRAER
jgi:hypothetical protein